MKSLKIKNIQSKNLISNEVGVSAAIIAKDKQIRKIVHAFQIKCAYQPPKKYNGSCLDGRDITYKIMPDADFKFFITANINTRALRRYKELKHLKKKHFNMTSLWQTPPKPQPNTDQCFPNTILSLQFQLTDTSRTTPKPCSYQNTIPLH